MFMGVWGWLGGWQYRVGEVYVCGGMVRVLAIPGLVGYKGMWGWWGGVIWNGSKQYILSYLKSMICII